MMDAVTPIELQTMWTAERVELLKHFYAAGQSASQIAMELADRTRSRFSRNAVIGKVHRLGLERRGPMAPRPPRPKVKQIARKNILRWGNGKLLETPDIHVEMPVIVEPLNLTLAALGPRQCRWITNDDAASALYCGHPTPDGTAWCAAHRTIVYRPVANRRDVGIRKLPLNMAGKHAMRGRGGCDA